MAKMSSCMGCGTPIPELLMDDGFNFRCTKCGCETRPQDTLEEAERLWNEGRLVPHNEEAFWEIIGNCRQNIATTTEGTRNKKMKYISKLPEIEAIRWMGYNTDEMAEFVGEVINGYHATTKDFRIGRPKGVLIADLGDYIIKDNNGDFYKLKPDVFEMIYDKEDDMK